MAQIDRRHKSYQMGLHDELLGGRTHRAFFGVEEEDNFVYPGSYDVDLDRIRTL